MVLNRRLQSFLLLFLFTIFLFSLPATAFAVQQVDSDFYLELFIDGQDVSTLDTVAVDPDGDTLIDLHIFGSEEEITLHSLSLVVLIAGQPVARITEDLQNEVIPPGEDYHNPEPIIFSPQQYLNVGSMKITTGIYNGRIELEYSTTGSNKIFYYPIKIRILGNPVSSLVGVIGMVATAAAAVSAAVLGISLVAAGSVVSSNVQLIALENLKRFALRRLEPTARGSVVGALVRAARKKIKKRYCPICSGHIKHDYCYSCKKTAKEAEKEYTEKVKALALQGIQLLASGEVKTMDALCARLGIDNRLGMDVIATLKNARLVKVKGIASKLMAKAVTTGISSAISIILWIAVGGFAILSTWMLLMVLFLALLLPILITKYFQWRAKKQLAAG